MTLSPSPGIFCPSGTDRYERECTLAGDLPSSSQREQKQVSDPTEKLNVRNNGLRYDP